MTTEYQMLTWSMLLGLAQLVIAVLAAIKVRGLGWAFSPRDSVMSPLPGTGGRLDRAFYNFMETFPFFAAAVLLTGAMGVHGPATVWGASLYFWARVAYLPVYAIGLPVVRTGIWGVSVLGIVMILVAAI